MNNLLTLGVDLGGTKVDTALVDSSGNIISSYYRLIDDSREPGNVIYSIIDSINRCCSQAGQKPSALGLGSAGQIDKDQGIVRDSPNLPSWHDVPLRARLEEALKIPVIVNNDVRMITYGEWQHGAGKGIDDLICVFVGTGIGGGVVTRGQLLEGCRNAAGELGHMTVVAGGRKCHCLNEGCLEAYSGGWAIAERARDAVRANPEGGHGLISLAGDIEKITAITVSEGYKNGDPLAQRLVKDTGRYLGAGLISAVNAFNPCLLILGGRVITGIPDLAAIAEKRIRSQALPAAARDLRISLGALGNKAGVIGAATLARQLVIKE